MINLWTWHTPDFSLTEGCVDPTKSQYQDTKAIIDAYHELYSLLDTDQIIWCCTSRDEHKITGREEIRWDLEVPESRVLRYVDGMVWNRILGKPCSVPSRLYYEWKDAACKLHPYDANASRAFIEEQRTNYWAHEPPPGGWWTKLFLDNIEGDVVWALLQHPIPSAWVMGQRLSQDLI